MEHVNGLKKKNSLPSQKSPSFLSSLLLCWTIPIIWRGFKSEVTQSDIRPPLPTYTTEKLGRRISELWKEELRLPNPSLSRILTKIFGFEYLVTFFSIIIAQCILRPSIPMLLGILIRYMDGSYSNQVGYLMTGIFILVTFLSTIISQKCNFVLLTMGMRIRVSLVSLAYEKALRLSQAALAQTGVGQLTNLISNDVNRFDRVMLYTPFIVACPIQMVIVGFVLWNYTGPACLVGIFFLILMIPTSAIVGHFIGKVRGKIAEITDIRIRLVAEILDGMLLLKMCTWEQPYNRKMAAIRSSEMKLVKKESKLYALTYSLFDVASKMSILLTFLTYVLTDHQFSTETAFVTLSMYNIISATSGIYFPLGVQGYFKVLVSIGRIQKFLLREEKQEENSESTAEASLHSSESVAVKVTSLSASWPNSGHPALSNVSLTVRHGDLLGVVGPVGSGKSTLLQAILGEVSREGGTVLAKGRVAYASQEPCFFEGSIKENILFGRPFEPIWYAEVVEACALSRDLCNLLHGDETLVVDKGANLSGGQKARINLARAAYSKADIILLDDPLSAVDVRVARHLMDKCVRGLLREKCVILVTHQANYLKEATEVISLEKGEIVNRGTFVQVCGSNESQNDSEFPTTIDDIFLEEIEDSGTLVRSLTAAKGTEKSYGTFEKQFAVEESRGSGLIPWSLYANYFRAGNSRVYLSFIVVISILAQVVYSGSDLWLKQWTDAEPLEARGLNSNVSTSDTEVNSAAYMNLGVYGCLVGFLFLFSLLRSFHIYNSLLHSAQVLHQKLFSAILRAPMRFFELNSVGRVLNRFSNDMGVMDEYLPQLIYIATVSFLQIFGSMVVVIITSPVLIIPTLVVLFLFYFMRQFYTTASARYKRLEGTSRSPVFAHFSTTLSGISVVRAHGAEQMFRAQFRSYQDIHTSNYYTYVATSRWFESTAELIVDLYISCVLLYFVLFSSSASALGLAVSATMTLVLDVTSAMREAAEIVTQIVSVERVMDYANAKPEAPLRNPNFNLSSTWVEKKDIRLDNITVAYDNGIEVLREINLQIRAGEKIGIIGRTGAGKSSLIAALFRIVEPSRGKIHISNVDVGRIGLHDLRSQLAIIPQSPVLFSGTIRQNLDPFNEYPDSELWNALEVVQLGARLGQSLGQTLDLTVSEGGSNFSHGEKQLICLARTILHKSKILVLDEATANIDTKTDSIIQATLRSRFKDSTVLTVAHRLETVMDSERILVLDAGRILEFDNPSNLLRDQQSFLYKLVLNTGPANAEKLKIMVAEAERRRCT